MCLCRLRELGSALAECSSLAELRMRQDALQKLPQELSSNKRLKIIEAGANEIAAFQQVQVYLASKICTRAQDAMITQRWCYKLLFFMLQVR